MESETPKLLPGEQTKVPDPEAVPKTVTTAAAFGAPRPITKDRDKTAGQRPDG